MLYRDFGNTGDKISVLGFGCMRLPTFEKDGVWYMDEEKAIPMLKHAYEMGVNYFDTGYYYCHNLSEAVVGKALHDVRDKVLISTKVDVKTAHTPKLMREWLERSLNEMNLTYIDYYHFWGLNKSSFDENVISGGLLKEALRAKDEGLIRHLSFSFHDKPESMSYIIDRCPELETVLAQYNILDRTNEEQFAYAASKGLGVVAMGPVGGGRLSAPAKLYKELMGVESDATYELALRFVLGNKNISCALSGMETVKMVDENLEVSEKANPLSEDEFKKITDNLDELKKFSELYCTGCAYCQPCPAEINIPHIFNMYTYHNVYGLSKAAAKGFGDYVKNTKKPGALSDKCADCGFCEDKCPQGLKVRHELKRVEEILRNIG